MAQFARTAEIVEKRKDQVPDWPVPGAVLLDGLRNRGVLAEAGDRLRFQRHGGYAAVCGFMALLVYFGVAPGMGLLPFYARAKGAWSRIAAPREGATGEPPGVPADRSKVTLFQRWSPSCPGRSTPGDPRHSSPR